MQITQISKKSLRILRSRYESNLTAAIDALAANGREGEPLSALRAARANGDVLAARYLRALQKRTEVNYEIERRG